MSSIDNSHVVQDTQTRVEQMLNRITAMEAEEKRLSKLCDTYKQEVNQLHEEKKYCQSQIDSIKTQAIELSADVKVGMNLLADLETKKTLVNSELSEATLKLTRIQNEAEVQKIQIIERENAVAKLEETVTKRELALSHNENLHKARVEKIQEALK